MTFRVAHSVAPTRGSLHPHALRCSYRATAMKVVTTFHQPSAVVSSASCHLLEDRSVRHLAVARPNKLEVYSAGEAGLKLESAVEIWGRASSVKCIPAQVRNYCFRTTSASDSWSRMILAQTRCLCSRITLTHVCSSILSCRTQTEHFHSHAVNPSVSLNAGHESPNIFTM